MLLKVYVDTSVIGGCFDYKFKRASLALFEDFKAGRKIMAYSDIVHNEIEKSGHSNRHLLYKFQEVPKGHKIGFDQNDEVYKLAEKYIQKNILTRKSLKDATHIAIATIFEADVLASWNFRHIVHKQKIRLYNETNIESGYKPIAIKTPEYILNSNNHEKNQRFKTA